MNINEILEVQELARVFSGQYAPDVSQQDANAMVLDGTFPVYVASRRRYSPALSGMTSQMNLESEHLQYAMTGSTDGYAASSRTAQTASFNMSQGALDPIFMYPASTRMTSDWVAAGSPAPTSTANSQWDYMHAPHFTWEHGGTYQEIDSGNYTPNGVMMIPVRNTTDTDLTIPASAAYLTSKDANYGPAGVWLLVAGAENPSIADPAVVTNVYKAAVNNNQAAPIPAMTIPAKRSAIIVLVSHFQLVKDYSNSKAWNCRVGPQASMWYYLTQTTGIVPDFNSGWGLLLNKGLLTNSYAGLFKDQGADLGDGVR